MFDYGLFQRFQYHLRYVKLVHWDVDVRILASKSIAKLVTVNRKKSLDLLPDMIKDCLSDNVHTRHGCLVGCAELVYALFIPAHHHKKLTTPQQQSCHSTSDHDQGNKGDKVEEEGEEENNNLLIVPSAAVLSDLIAIIPQLQALRMFRKKGAEVLRIATCYLREKISECFISLPGKVQVEYLDIINENLKQPHRKVQIAAQTALRQFLFVYFNSKQSSLSTSPTERLQNATVRMYLKGLMEEENVAVTRGYAFAIGVLPSRFSLLAADGLEGIISVLAKAVNAEHLVKKTAVSSSVSIVTEMSVEVLPAAVAGALSASEDSEMTAKDESDIQNTLSTAISVLPLPLPLPEAPVAETTKPPLPAVSAPAVLSATDTKIEEFKKKYLEKLKIIKNKEFC